MSKRRKRNSTIPRAAVLVAVGLFLLILAVGALYALAVFFGLAPYAFIVAAFAGLGALIVYVAILAGWLWFNRRTLEANQLRALQLADVDHMDGSTFERYVSQLLTSQGYHVRSTGRSGDLGVDLVAIRPPLQVAVQVKRQSEPVSRRAISDAVAGMPQYRCNAAMVVTNNYFSPGAQELARSNRCQLVDRKVLSTWILAFQNGARR